MEHNITPFPFSLHDEQIPVKLSKSRGGFLALSLASIQIFYTGVRSFLSYHFPELQVIATFFLKTQFKIQYIFDRQEFNVLCDHFEFRLTI